MENEKTIKHLEKETSEWDKVQKENLSLNQTLSTCEEFFKFTHQNFQLMLAEYSEVNSQWSNQQTSKYFLN